MSTPDDEDDIDDIDDIDDEIVSGQLPSDNVAKNYSTTVSTPGFDMKHVGVILIGVVVLYFVIYCLTRMFFPKKRQPPAKPKQILKENDGSVGPITVERIMYDEKHGGWLLDLNKALCTGGVGFCTDDGTSNDIKNKWCSYTCRAMRRQPPAHARAGGRR